MVYSTDIKGDPIGVFLFYKNDQIVRKRLNDRPSYRTFLLDGYALPQTFQSILPAVLPDRQAHRRTLYWNPDLKTDVSGKIEVRLYTPQKDKPVQVSTQGLVQ
jgi:hypothetical protein